jgi:hypothetical protein
VALNSGQQDVDIFYNDEGGTGKHAIEVAATVSKLREKLSEDGQFNRYTKLRVHDDKITLGYAVGETGKWLELFASAPSIKRLIDGERELHIEGVILSPANLQHILGLFIFLSSGACNRLKSIPKTSLEMIGELWASPTDALRMDTQQAECNMINHQIGANGIKRLRDYDGTKKEWTKSIRTCNESESLIRLRGSGIKDPLCRVADHMNSAVKLIDRQIENLRKALHQRIMSGQQAENDQARIEDIAKKIDERHNAAINAVEERLNTFKERVNAYNTRVLYDSLKILRGL